MAHLIKWQLLLLHKNNIILISFAVTAIYGIVLFLLSEIKNLDHVLVVIVLNDPTVIGYFFIALSIYTEIKHQILPALFTSPLNLHQYIWSKTIALTLIGWICALGLVWSIKGLDFNLINYSIGVITICLLSALMGFSMVTFASEFLKFSLYSVPIFLGFVTVPMLQYLKVIDIGLFKYLFPIQASVDFIENAISRNPIHTSLLLLNLMIWIIVFYFIAYRLFNRKMVLQ